MLHFLHADQLHTQPELRDSMFRDRADQFRTRLGWEVSVTEHGEERDQYDDLNPLYVIWETGGRHGGSMRFLPTSGRTMINEHFLGLLDGRPLHNDRIWECTRFCLSRGAAPNVSAALMLGGAELGLGRGLDFSVGVFDARMVRIYGRLGWSPAILGSTGEGRDAISAGLWHYSEEVADRLAAKAGIARARSRSWYHLAMDRAARLGRPRLVVA
ncbi:acyl-homoserine-lactone synthase [Mangrovicoccus sp. HB161399]|uniref:acyl-homoserine-lactone synthase n=1 Tax=Mangrovicoccus sp. HB161399 TaxID=2720392 RepID=UPI0015558868|nr:acyl-homoserine-lactone synthase [Mangrovicoccus sp. HB161399]